MIFLLCIYLHIYDERAEDFRTLSAIFYLSGQKAEQFWR